MFQRFDSSAGAAVRFGAVLLALSITAGATQAQTFRATLGDRVIGTLTYDGGATQTLRTVLDNTPLGVGDGTFEGVTRAAKTSDGRRVIQYVGTSRSSRKGRKISVLLDGGRVIQTEITPDSERTALSDPAAVPANVMDPVSALARLIRAKSCPAAFRLYDGRRAIRISPVRSRQWGGLRTCEMHYDVIVGPGHLSPFGFKALTLDLTYDSNGLLAMEIRTGPFRLYLRR